MQYFLFLLVLGAFLLPTLRASNVFNKVSSNISNSEGVLLAFADINSDHHNDVLVLSESQRGVDVLFIDQSGSTYKRRSLLESTPGQSPVRSLVPTDLNGDSILDLLVLTSKTNRGPYKAFVCYGTKEDLGFKKPIMIGDFASQPLLMQWNADMITDIYVQLTTGQRVVLLGRRSGNFTQKVIVEKSVTFTTSAFVDLNKDNENDIFTAVELKDGSVEYQVFVKSRGEFDHNNPIKIAAPKLMLYGQPVFADFNMDGNIEILLPGCEDADCKLSRLFLHTKLSGKWLDINFDNNRYGFLPASVNPFSKAVDLLGISSFVVGDANLDTFPDGLAVMRPLNTVGSDDPLKTSLMLLLNSKGGKSFKLVPVEGITDRPMLAGFSDFGDVGIFSIAATSLGAKSGSKKSLVHTYRQGSNGDSYFIKTVVLSGTCATSASCPNNRLPYGIPVTGPVVRYSTEAPSGGRMDTRASLNMNTGYVSLSLSFHVFGLGSFSNYIEKLGVTLPNFSKDKIRDRVFSFIVPKTQLVINPYPLDNPAKWKSVLFLDPFTDMKVIYVAITLLGVCFVVILVIVILQYLEVRADRIEKMQEAQKFNFDAM